jgi:hypothetical protein
VDLITDTPSSLDLHSLEAPADKIAAETAILLREIACVPDAALAAEATRLAHRLAPIARSPRVVAALAIRPAVARDVAAPHIVLTAMGVGAPEVQAALDAALQSTVAGARERLPHRALEQDWLDAVRLGAVSSDRWVPETALVRGLDLPGANRDDLYAFTHAVAYATDFGRWKPPADIDPGQATAVAESALAAVLDADDFDLAAELLLTWPCLGEAMSSTARFAFDVLRRVEDEAGVLPSLAISTDEIDRQPPESRDAYLTAVTYHTAYVMGLLCAVLLRCGVRLQSRDSSVDGHRIAQELLTGLARESARKQWITDAATLTSEDLGALLPFLRDVALQRAVRAMDLTGARDILVRTTGHGATGSALALQVAELLSRLASSERLLADNVGTRTSRTDTR